MRPRRAAGLAAAAATVLLTSGCFEQAPADLARKAAPPPAASDPAKPCTREAPAGTGGAGGGQVTATFDRGTNTIRLTAGQNVTMAALRRAVGTDAALRQTGQGEWLLAANLEIDKGASMTLAAPDTRWLKLRSVGDQFASVVALGGNLAITGSCVTSWDDTKQTVDTDFQHARGFLLARGGATMTIDKAELAYLGYGNKESYGLSWREKGTTGHLADSVVSHNYFGVYTYDVGGLVLSGNDIHDNAVYGVDPHTGSHDLKIVDNTVHDNKKHGIILADNCVNSVISGNVVYRNGHHGIVLYQHSDKNKVTDNDTFLNEAQGININQANGNAITGNRVYDNEDSGIGLGQAGQDNVVKGNDIRGNKVDGIRLVTAATTNELRDNLIGQNARYGVYVDSNGPFTLAGNTIWDNKAAVLLKGATTPTQIGNSMFGNQVNGVRTE